jgi:hypothetical protein
MLRTIDQIVIEHPREPLPESVRRHRGFDGTGKSIGKNDPHRGLSGFHIC